MLGSMVDELLNGSRWLQMGVLVGGLLIGASRLVGRPGESPRDLLLQRLHLLYAPVIALQGVGHIVAVNINAHRGTLETTTPLFVLDAVGAVYVLPSLWLGVLVWRGHVDTPVTKRRLVMTNSFLAVALLVAIFPGPLAILAFLNIAALRRDTAKTTRVVWVATAVAYAAMFVASFFVGGP